MEKKVIIDVGLAFTNEQFEQLLEASKYYITFIGLSDHCKYLEKNINSPQFNCLDYVDLYSDHDYDISKDNTDIVEIINEISWDKNTIDIWDRCKAPVVFNYAMKSENDIIYMIINSYKYLQSEKPEFLLFYECAHSIQTWIIGKVAESIGIPVRYCRNGIFHWRNVLLEGMNRHAKLITDPEINQSPKKDEIDYFKHVEENYQLDTEAIKPEFMVVMKERKQKKLFSFWHDLKNNWTRPYVSIYKNACYGAYNKVCEEFINKGKYIVFFMHLQPERTTLPEGYGFCNHYKVLQILSDIIPKDWTIYVKEHPANFYTKCSPCGRWPSFYTDIAKINNVSFVPLETDPYLMISNCECVTTITGTIARESLMMGKPVINFGLNTLYTDLPLGMYNYIDYSSLKAFFTRLSDFKSDEIKKSFHDLLVNKVLKEGVNGFDNMNEWQNSGNCIIPANQKSRFEIFKYVLSK
jgi:hypothetical protein